MGPIYPSVSEDARCRYQEAQIFTDVFGTAPGQLRLYLWVLSITATADPLPWAPVILVLLFQSIAAYELSHIGRPKSAGSTVRCASLWKVHERAIFTTAQ